MIQLSAITRLVLAAVTGCLALMALLVFFAARVPYVQAAPVVRPQWQSFTGTTLITHTSATTHEMAVFGDGRITNQFRTDNPTKTNQIGVLVTATTLAVAFDQHPPDSVDVGSQGDFSMTGPITLHTNSTFPGVLEDTVATYASNALSYQITQRTLAVESNNCVIMELFIRNTGAISLTGGMVLFMVDTQAGELPISDIGGFDGSRNLVHQADYNVDTDFGYAVGISLLEGVLRGYGAKTKAAIPDPTIDSVLRAEMTSPSNAIINGGDNVIWLVADIPTLSSDQTNKMVFSLCARTVENPGGLSEPDMEELARQALFVTYSDLVNLAVSKQAEPPSGTPVFAGNPLTYTIALTSTGEVYVDNIVVTDQVPPSTTLISYSVSQGSIIAADGIVTATVGRLYPTSPTVLMQMVVAPLTSVVSGTLITNQAFINSEPIITNTNVVTHRIIGRPDFNLTKEGVNNWRNRIKLTFDNSSHSENLVNFPVLVVLNSSRIDYSQTQNNGQDIRFIDADGALLSHEIERWNESGNSYVWVKVPQIDASSSSDYIWMYYGNSATPDRQHPESVWSNDYKGVWHLNQPSAGAGSKIQDSTGTTNPGITHGSLTPADLVSGQVDGSFNFDRPESDFIEIPHVPGYLIDEGTIEFWFNTEDTSNRRDLWSKDSAGLDDGGHLSILLQGGTNLTARLGSTTSDHTVSIPTPVSIDTWYYAVFRFGPGGMRLSLNAGTPQITPYTGGLGTSSGGSGNIQPIAVGAGTYVSGDGVITPTIDHFDGTIDEVRISSVARSGEWIAAQYESMNDNFIIFGSSESLDVQTGPPMVVGLPFTYTLTITNTGNEADTEVIVIDPLPEGANYVSGGTLNGGNVNWTVPTIAPLGGTAQVSFVVTTCQEILINDNYQVITSTLGFTTPPGPPIISLLAPPTFNLQINHSPSPAKVGQLISFNSNSTTNSTPIVNWAWNFGDGSTGNGPTTNHAYSAPGIYAVTLTVTDACNFLATTTAAVTIIVPDLIVTKQANPEPVAAGARLTYRITLSNPTGVDATDIVVSDPLPNNTTFVPNSVVINPVSAGGTLDVPPIIASGLTVTANSLVTITYQVTVASPLVNGTLITNSVSVSSSEITPPRLATTTSTVTSIPELVIIKSAEHPSPLRPGDLITYTIVVQNEGNAQATNAVISDSLPANTSFVAGSISLEPAGGGTVGTAPPTLVSNLFITAGQEITVSYAVIVDTPLDDGTAIRNTAAVTSAQTPVPITDTVVSIVSANPNLTIDKSAIYAPPLAPGERLTYTIVIGNEGDANATGAVVSDALPANTTFVPGSLTLAPSNAGVLGSFPVLVSNLVVTSGQHVTVTFAVTVDNSLPPGTVITNTASITSPEDPGPNTDTVTATVSIPELVIIKSAEHPSPLRPGDLITYTIVVQNEGNAQATNAVISDSLPANTGFVAGSISLEPAGAGTVGTTPPTLASDLFITMGQTITVSYAVIVDTPLDDGTAIRNTAAVSSAQTPTPVTDTVVSIVSATPDLTIDKSAIYSPPLAPGERLTYTIVIGNEGDANATGAVVSDALPANTTLVPGSLTLAPSNAGVLGSFPVLVSNLVVTSGQHVTVTFAVTVNNLLPNGTVITNTASITSPEDPGPKADTVTTTVSAEPGIQLVKTGPVSASVLSTVIYTFTLVNEGNTLLQDIELVDDLLGAVTNLLPGSDSNGNNQIEPNETWVYTAAYTIPSDVSSLLTNTAVVTATDGLFTTVTDSDSHVTVVIFNPVLVMTKTGPSAATVGSPVVFTFRVHHGSGSDASPFHEVRVTDDYAGSANFVGGDTNGDNQLDFNEIWTFSVNYTIEGTEPNPLINTGTATAKDMQQEIITAVATHSTSLSGFDPLLFVDKDGSPQVEVGDMVTYSFTVINVDFAAITRYNLAGKISIATVGDGSPIDSVSVTDNKIPGVNYINGDLNGNNILDGGEAWYYEGTHTFVADDPDPLVNVVTVVGTDQEGDVITATDSHSTNVSQNPVLQIVNTGPVTATLGDEIELTFSVSHAPTSDGSAVTNITVTDSLAGPVALRSGDNGDNRLEGGETWIYSAEYFVPDLSPDTLTGRVQLQGRDLDNDIISRTRNYTIPVENPLGIRLFFFPIILKN